MGVWDRDRRIRVLAISPCYPCQLSCIYCDLPTNAKYINEGNNREYAKYAERMDIEELVRAFEEEGRLQPSCPIEISCGEITISPNKEKLLKAVEKYPLQIFTNAIIFDEQIAELASRMGSCLNVSIDSGTRESYKTVKGMDAFEKVCENLRKYRVRGCHLLLKYIILPENNNELDINGFISLCKELEPISVSISCDLHINTSELPKEIADGAASMARRLGKIGIHADILSLYGKDNLQYIYEKLREKNG